MFWPENWKIDQFQSWRPLVYTVTHRTFLCSVRVIHIVRCKTKLLGNPPFTKQSNICAKYSVAITNHDYTPSSDHMPQCLRRGLFVVSNRRKEHTVRTKVPVNLCIPVGCVLHCITSDHNVHIFVSRFIFKVPAYARRINKYLSIYL